MSSFLFVLITCNSFTRRRICCVSFFFSIIHLCSCDAKMPTTFSLAFASSTRLLFNSPKKLVSIVGSIIGPPKRLIDTKRVIAVSSPKSSKVKTES
ncbi:hypothetical protein Hanom_Chr17g01528491 [Helianthus anomalus]